jgi:cysteine desulfurase/selenocysteine lyase
VEQPLVKNAFDVLEVRKDFPILSELPYGKPLVYFDNAATSQKPQVVIDALVNYYTHYNANVHRGVHFLSQKASDDFDGVREKVRGFINAASEREIIFVRGTTEGVNLVAATYGRKNIQQGDTILVSAMEHHSNIVPWQLLCDEKGARLNVIPMNDRGELVLDTLDELLNDKCKFVAITHTANSLGTINPLETVIAKAHERNIPVLVDGAQAVAHDYVDVQALDCDFFVFSAHKMLGPTGIGAVYGKLHLLEEMPPYHGGGEMIKSVSFKGTTWNDVPYKFEAGTPNIADVIALGAAIDYWNSIDRVGAHEQEIELLNYCTSLLADIPAVRIIGTAKNKAAVISFVVDKANAMDIGMFLDTKGIAVRTGQHCAEPVMDWFGIPGTIRASFMFYNTKEEIDFFIEQLKKAIQLLAV